MSRESANFEEIFKVFWRSEFGNVLEVCFDR